MSNRINFKFRVELYSQARIGFERMPLQYRDRLACVRKRHIVEVFPEQEKANRAARVIILRARFLSLKRGGLQKDATLFPCSILATGQRAD